MREAIAACWNSLLRLLAGAGPWLALTLLGAFVLVVGPSNIPLLTVGAQLGVAIGTAGIGAFIGRSRADELTRARLAPLFTNSVGAGRGLTRLSREVEYARVDCRGKQKAQIPYVDVEAHLRAIAVRIDEQGTMRVDDLEFWRVLLPREVADLEAGVQT